jgi:predicted pyridoxine 5'-phosphate oxidase superfamily flavin-nucleotide-binding protein
MGRAYSDITFTPTVREVQAEKGSREQYAFLDTMSDRGEALTPREAQFLAEADHFFQATVSETGWPYVQHRGGPPGFLKVVSPTRIAFADFRGNRQFVSVGNVSRDDRASMIVVDYLNRRRLKLLGHLTFADLGEADPEFVFAVELPDYSARMERVAMFDVDAFEWNCPHHIPQRFSAAQVEAVVNPLRARIAQLESELAARI